MKVVLKLKLWHSRISNCEIDCFENLNKFLSENNIQLHNKLKISILAHLEQLSKNFDFYFPADPQKVDFGWISNPFLNFESPPPHLTVVEAEEFIDATTDESVKQSFNSANIPEFWISLMHEYPHICDRALRILVKFATSYLCESAFSHYLRAKSKYRSRLEAAADLRLKLSPIVPNFEKLSNNMQSQPSH